MRSGGMRSGGLSSSKYRRSTASASVPNKSESSRPGLAGTIAQGMAFGAGSEMAHTAVRGMTGANSQVDNDQQMQQPDLCFQQHTDFLNCLMASASNIGHCQLMLDRLKACRNES